MSKKKILVCRIDKDPEVEEVEDVFDFASKLVGGLFIETQTIIVEDEEVTAFFAEKIDNNLRFNRNLPSKCPYIPEDVSFVVDTRKGPPEQYAKPGELGYFHIYGHFLLTKIVDGEHVSLSDRVIKTCTTLLTLPKCKRCKTKPLAYPGAIYCGAACTAMAEAGD